MHNMTFTAVLYLIVGVVMLGLLIHFTWERRIVRRYAAHAVVGCDAANAIARAMTVCAAVYRDVSHLPDDESFIRLPGFTSLGATPGGVLRQGGCCSGKSRVAIVALHSLGIHAAQATLYHVNGRAQHCLIEVRSRGVTALIDPMYGLYYVGAEGRPVGIAHLRSGEKPRLLSLVDGSSAAYPDNAYYRFDFVQTRTANWTKSMTRRASYRVMSWATRNRVDELRQPVFTEWPQIMVCSFLASGLLAVMMA